MANVAALQVREASQNLRKPMAALGLLHSAAAFHHGEQFPAITKREYSIDEVGVVQALDLQQTNARQWSAEAKTQNSASPHQRPVPTSVSTFSWPGTDRYCCAASSTSGFSWRLPSSIITCSTSKPTHRQYAAPHPFHPKSQRLDWYLAHDLDGHLELRAHEGAVGRHLQAHGVLDLAVDALAQRAHELVDGAGAREDGQHHAHALHGAAAQLGVHEAHLLRDGRAQSVVVVLLRARAEDVVGRVDAQRLQLLLQLGRDLLHGVCVLRSGGGGGGERGLGGCALSPAFGSAEQAARPGSEAVEGAGLGRRFRVGVARSPVSHSRPHAETGGA
ncbi:hypothetical protein ON010_g16945 [Phytophthora cinnamomi]|nr:hypothetical protein ON010_g16945 [Phytophthora cinnamomi]